MKLFKNKETLMKIMVCYDTSEAADNALSLAQAYAKKWHAAIDVVSAIRREDPLDQASQRNIEEDFQARVKERFHAVDIPYAGHMLIKPFAIGEQLVMFSENRDYEFIFIGISKRSKTGKLLYGSTAQYIILNAPCPVISTNGIGRIL
jgi:nucleotide-binding universal stress UspA family protein